MNRHLFSACIAAALIGFSSCGSDDPNEPTGPNDFIAEASFSQQIDVIGHLRLRLDAVSGSVEITGSASSSTVRIEGERRVASDSMEDAEERLEGLQVQVSDQETDIIVSTSQPSDTEGRDYVVDYRITLPDDLLLFVDNANGPVSVESMNSTVLVDNINGTVTLDDIVGSTSINIINGQLSAEVTLPTGGDVDMDVLNGAINLGIPGNTSASFSARVVNGIIDVSGLNLQNESVTDNTVSGTLGSGQGTIDLSVTNGLIEVSEF